MVGRTTIAVILGLTLVVSEAKLFSSQAMDVGGHPLSPRLLTYPAANCDTWADTCHQCSLGNNKRLSCTLKKGAVCPTGTYIGCVRVSVKFERICDKYNLDDRGGCARDGKQHMCGWIEGRDRYVQYPRRLGVNCLKWRRSSSG